MKRISLIFITLVTYVGSSFSQVVSISDAKAEGANSTVSVSGTVLNGSELDPVIRYIQDETGGLAVYSSTYASQMSRGDKVEITGQLTDYYNLLELNPVSDFTKISSGNALPEPAVLSPDQWDEDHEGMLVKVEKVVFAAGGTTFAGKTNYTITAEGQSGEVRINSTSSPLVGQVIPVDTVTLIGILSQYSTYYQLLLRDADDIISSKAISLRSTVTTSNISTSGFDLSWVTDVVGSTEAQYGKTPDLELGTIPDQGESKDHTLSISGAQPAEVYYVRPFSVLGEDTVKAPVGVYITASGSSGNMKVYFNRTVDNSVAIATNAIQLDHAIDDTLIDYINRAQESIDIAIYNFNNSGISNISNALNAAYDRGIKIRVVYDGNTDNAGINGLDPGIGKIASPESVYPIYGIMHNKFVIFDADATDPNVPVLWTGSTNFTDGQINTDPNNVIIIQDQSLAKAYTLEFNEMFGSEGLQPDASKSRFGPDKTDNTPHDFVIGGTKVECYFSPSDGTNARILENISSADYQLYVATMLITRTDIGYAIRDQKNAGADVKVLLNDIDESTASAVTVSTTLQGSIGGNFRTTGETGIMHDKYLVADPSHSDSDPLVLTGSHNWSSSAEQRNDENTLVIHSQEIADQYYQDFTARFQNGVTVADAPACVNDYYTLSSGNSINYNVTNNDNIPSEATLSIIKQPSHGTASVNANTSILYTPDNDFTYGLDTISYEVCLVSDNSLCNDANFVVYVNRPSSVGANISDRLLLYPNPVKDVLFINSSKSVTRLVVMDANGRKLFAIEPGKSKFSLSLPEAKGIYFIRLNMSDGESLLKKVVKK